ncbi:MAG TPA: alpha-amylase family glycosyl hydrolase [Bacteroidales bacterium]|nr:alpha-amylase family glycosyl hydrolase [Bacteroidales bacterium]HOL97879.1 alpha-amylase family glycosyl hydrolase [Bacteroidales bacterium]HOM35624.1 alpha-amylase family glycosyl hydrolase [Bacteroidales bacterium]HPD22815.1 alpha-amylase family glycosyl hydrolase [Bacteroidales bacterium]HRS98922.1 alpha-amylase family glycosyl hydrolase [Bacteroidales bacterium]
MYKISFFFVLILLVASFFSCNSNKKSIFNAENDPIYGIASVQILNPYSNDTLMVFLEDYIPDFSGIDSIIWNAGEYEIKDNILLIKENKLNPLSIINIYKGNDIYSIICKTLFKEEVNLEFVPPVTKTYSTVQIAGDFNSWSPQTAAMIFDGSKWYYKLNLDPGVYQYQLVCDGKWINNPNSTDTVPNGIGGYNTALRVAGTCSYDNLFIDTKSFDDESINLEFSDVPDVLLALWQNQLMPIDLKNFNEFIYKIEIPREAQKLERSYIRIYASKDKCFYNDVLIPLHFGKVITDTKLLTREDKHTNILYSLLVDRFCNGRNDNDAPLKDSRVEPRANFNGGDLAGIIKQLNSGYFNNLGISCLWISPIFRNPDEAYKEFPAPNRFYSGYHGYWPISLTQIDPRFGTEQEFKDLVNIAHNNKINVILDFVANHVHEKNPLYKNNPDWATPLNLPDGRKNIRIWEEYRLTTWFDTFLPSWNFEIPEVTDTISNLAIYWLNKYNLDGFRHDATKHIPEVFWRTLTRKIKTNFPEKSIYQIGETFGSRELIGRYVGSGMLDGQFDFNLYFDARNAFANENSDMQTLAASLYASFNQYGFNHLMGNITGNHDLIRFITYADGGVLPGEDDKEAGWKRQIVTKNIESYQKLRNLFCFIMTIPGVPCIYYGDEIGLPGAGDPDNRRMMNFEDLDENQLETKNIVNKLISIRKNNIEFIYGTTRMLESRKGLIIYKRKFFDKESFILINQKNEIESIFIKKNYIEDLGNYVIQFGCSVKNTADDFVFVLKPYSFEIITKKR